MSARFASLTAGLLVRKGEARPSSVLAPMMATPMPSFMAPVHSLGHVHEAEARTPEPVLEPEIVREPRRVTASGGPPPGGTTPPDCAKPRRLMVTLTPAEHETLGLMAVKKNSTRHQLLRNALDEYMALLSDEYGGDCQCILTGGGCASPCGQTGS